MGKKTKLLRIRNNSDLSNNTCGTDHSNTRIAKESDNNSVDKLTDKNSTNENNVTISFKNEKRPIFRNSSSSYSADSKEGECTVKQRASEFIQEKSFFSYVPKPNNVSEKSFGVENSTACTSSNQRLSPVLDFSLQQNEVFHDYDEQKNHFLGSNPGNLTLDGNSPSYKNQTIYYTKANHLGADSTNEPNSIFKVTNQDEEADEFTRISFNTPTHQQKQLELVNLYEDQCKPYNSTDCQNTNNKVLQMSNKPTETVFTANKNSFSSIGKKNSESAEDKSSENDIQLDSQLNSASHEDRPSRLEPSLGHSAHDTTSLFSAFQQKKKHTFGYLSALKRQYKSLKNISSSVIQPSYGLAEPGLICALGNGPLTSRVYVIRSPTALATNVIGLNFQQTRYSDIRKLLQQHFPVNENSKTKKRSSSKEDEPLRSIDNSWCHYLVWDLASSRDNTLTKYPEFEKRVLSFRLLNIGVATLFFISSLCSSILYYLMLQRKHIAFVCFRESESIFLSILACVSFVLKQHEYPEASTFRHVEKSDELGNILKKDESICMKHLNSVVEELEVYSQKFVLYPQSSEQEQPEFKAMTQKIIDRGGVMNWKPVTLWSSLSRRLMQSFFSFVTSESRFLRVIPYRIKTVIIDNISSSACNTIVEIYHISDLQVEDSKVVMHGKYPLVYQHKRWSKNDTDENSADCGFYSSEVYDTNETPETSQSSISEQYSEGDDAEENFCKKGLNKMLNSKTVSSSNLENSFLSNSSSLPKTKENRSYGGVCSLLGAYGFKASGSFHSNTNLQLNLVANRTSYVKYEAPKSKRDDELTTITFDFNGSPGANSEVENNLLGNKNNIASTGAGGNNSNQNLQPMIFAGDSLIVIRKLNDSHVRSCKYCRKWDNANIAFSQSKQQKSVTKEESYAIAYLHSSFLSETSSNVSGIVTLGKSDFDISKSMKPYISDRFQVCIIVEPVSEQKQCSNSVLSVPATNAIPSLGVNSNVGVVKQQLESVKGKKRKLWKPRLVQRAMAWASPSEVVQEPQVFTAKRSNNCFELMLSPRDTTAITQRNEASHGDDSSLFQTYHVDTILEKPFENPEAFLRAHSLSPDKDAISILLQHGYSASDTAVALKLSHNQHWGAMTFLLQCYKNSLDTQHIQSVNKYFMDESSLLNQKIDHNTKVTRDVVMPYSHSETQVPLSREKTNSAVSPVPRLDINYVQFLNRLEENENQNDNVGYLSSSSTSTLEEDGTEREFMDSSIKTRLKMNKNIVSTESEHKKKNLKTLRLIELSIFKKSNEESKSKESDSDNKNNHGFFCELQKKKSKTFISEEDKRVSESKRLNDHTGVTEYVENNIHRTPEKVLRFNCRSDPIYSSQLVQNFPHVKKSFSLSTLSTKVEDSAVHLSNGNDLINGVGKKNEYGSSNGHFTFSVTDESRFLNSENNLTPLPILSIKTLNSKLVQNRQPFSTSLSRLPGNPHLLAPESKYATILSKLDLKESSSRLPGKPQLLAPESKYAQDRKQKLEEFLNTSKVTNNEVLSRNTTSRYPGKPRSLAPESRLSSDVSLLQRSNKESEEKQLIQLTEQQLLQLRSRFPGKPKLFAPQSLLAKQKDVNEMQKSVATTAAVKTPITPERSGATSMRLCLDKIKTPSPAFSSGSKTHRPFGLSHIDTDQSSATSGCKAMKSARLQEPKGPLGRRIFWKPLTAHNIEGTIFAELGGLTDSENNSKAKDVLKQPLDMTALVNTNFLSRLFVNQGAADAAKIRQKAMTARYKDEGKKLLDAKRAQNLCIVLARLKFDTQTVSTILLNLDTSCISLDDLNKIETLIVTSEEDTAFKNHFGQGGSRQELREAPEKLLIPLLPSVCYRPAVSIEIMRFKLSHLTLVSDVNRDLNILKKATIEVKLSVRFRQLLSVVLRWGNYINHGVADNNLYIRGFTLGSLVRLAEFKTTVDTSITAMHFLIANLLHTSPEFELQKLSEDMPTVFQAAKVSGVTVTGNLESLKKGQALVRSEFALLQGSIDQCTPEEKTRFQRRNEVLRSFEAELGIAVEKLVMEADKICEEVYTTSRFFGEESAHQTSTFRKNFQLESFFVTLRDFLIKFTVCCTDILRNRAKYKIVLAYSENSDSSEEEKENSAAAQKKLSLKKQECSTVESNTRRNRTSSNNKYEVSAAAGAESLEDVAPENTPKMFINLVREDNNESKNTAQSSIMLDFSSKFQNCWVEKKETSSKDACSKNNANTSQRSVQSQVSSNIKSESSSLYKMSYPSFMSRLSKS